MAPRLQIYLKVSSAGTSEGGCPFSGRVNMVTRLKVPESDYEFKPIDMDNKPPEFLKVNPSGEVPVLVDQETGLTVTDSGKITQYIESLYPNPPLKSNYDGPAVEATGGVFGGLAKLLFFKNKDEIPQLKANLTAELKKVDDYLKSDARKGKYLLDNEFRELDCMLVPRLRHVEIAGKYFHNYEIPSELTALTEYNRVGQAAQIYQTIIPTDEDIVKSWTRHGVQRAV
ncbi:probable glutathione S-transferase DHAR1, cytosolic [Aplysia californica]|uniref:Probable glutathione S-transferase DHAR1, cytosolic n=1 Tax=Aplysia californica TaxID=6500 RepID=A0ABM1ACW6_APLCA|nr:probable glutathione S-transferase DHAR1, cytosolic [Aplysia californica]